MLLVTAQSIGGISRMPGAGGPLQPLTKPVEGRERTHRWAELLPGGKAVIFTVGDFNNPDNYFGARIDAHVLATGERKTLLTGAEMARYSPPGHLIFARAGSLYAVPFDLDTLTAGDASAPLIDGVSGDVTTGAAHFDISPSGALAYIASGGDQSLTRPAWVDRAGGVQHLDVPPGIYADPAISPDGRKVALSVIAGGGRDIWIYSVDRRNFMRATFGGQNVTPIWSRDGAWVYYASLDPAESSGTIWRRAADGSRDAESLVTLPYRLYLNAISDDGRKAVFDFSHAGSRGSDIGTVALDKGAKGAPFISTASDEFTSRVSPDGVWLAYEATESGRSEIYVRPVDPNRTGRWQVSSGGGREPKWAPDGRTLYFRYENQLWAAAVDPGPAFQNGVPARVLNNVYDPRIETGVAYDVHRDGRFMMIRLADEKAVSSSIRLITNWVEQLRKAGAAR